jgi:hypothetical protein
VLFSVCGQSCSGSQNSDEKEKNISKTSCPKCNKEKNEGEKYCATCQYAFDAYCPRCDVTDLLKTKDDKYCEKCEIELKNQKKE